MDLEQYAKFTEWFKHYRDDNVGHVENTIKQWAAMYAWEECSKQIEQLKKQNIELLEALTNLESEFRKTFPIYYYAEPWAHDGNTVLKEAQVIINKATKGTK